MVNDIFKTVGENILNELKQKSITQQSFANSLGISKQVLNKIIKGQKAINVGEINMISKLLNVSTDALMIDKCEDLKNDPQFSFMGEIKKDETKAKFNMLREVIDEILFLEEYSNESEKM